MVCWATIEGDGPDRVQLIPAMLGVIDPSTGQGDLLSNMRFWQVATIARHELDHEIAVLLCFVARIEQPAVCRVECKVDV